MIEVDDRFRRMYGETAEKIFVHALACDRCKKLWNKISAHKAEDEEYRRLIDTDTLYDI